MARSLTNGTAVAAALAALLALPGCGGDVTPKPRIRDVLLVTVDTARADRFSYTGSTAPGTPRVDALSGAGAGFTQAISPAPLTLPAHASLMTGRLPPSTGVRDNGVYRLAEGETTLAEALHDAGFATAAFLGAEVLDHRYGLDQGFDVYDDAMPQSADAAFLYYPERNAEQVVAAASAWLARRDDGPVFAWVHLFDPHTPYRPPEPERSRYAEPYDGEIAYVDRMIGRLLDDWEARRGLERTLVVVTADHGEALGEHGEATHGVLVHDATLRVPLVIRTPGLPAVGRVDEPVHLVDVMPTVLSLLGVAVPESVQGRDLGPALRGQPLAWSPLSGYSESLYGELHHGTASLVALREDGYKLVRGVDEELYDLGSDPGELTDVAADRPEIARRMSGELDGVVRRIGGGEAAAVTLDDEARRMLESLGYVWSRPPSKPDGTPSRDPREALESMRRMADADRLVLAGQIGRAIEAYRDVIRVEPASIDARVRLAQLLIAQGRAAEAVEPLKTAVAVNPHEPFLHRKLANTLESLKRYNEALAVYDAGLALHPEDRDLRNERWRCMNSMGLQARILDEAERAIAADPGDGVARYVRAIACCGADIDGYLAALEREWAELPGDPTLAAALDQARREAAATRGGRR